MLKKPFFSLAGHFIRPLITMLVLSWTLSAHATAQQLDPVDFLSRKRHLSRVDNYWITPTEMRIRNNLVRVAKLASDLRLRQQQYEQALANNANWRQMFDQATQEKKKIESALSSNRLDSRRKDQYRKRLEQLKNRIADLDRLSSPADKLGSRPVFRRLQIDRINLQNALALILLQSRKDLQALPGDYKRLSKDPEVTKAITGLKIAGQLGPIRDYRQPVKELKRYESVAFPDTVPTYLVGEKTRCSVLLNDRTPATFTWSSGCDTIRITTNAARAGGLKVPADAPSEFRSFTGGRRLKVTRVTIPVLRVGQQVFRDLPALLLPPEGEDLGSSLGPIPLGGMVSEDATIQRLKIVKQDPRAGEK